jgi:hypothetical protein
MGKYLLKLLFVVLISVSFGQVLQAQSSLYTFTQTTVANAYLDITTPGNVPNLAFFQVGAQCNVDSISGPIFTNQAGGFTYNCKQYNTVHIANNGWIALQPFGTLTVNATNAAVGTLNINAEGIIQPFGCALVASTNPSVAAAGSSISYANVGTNFIIQYKNMARTATTLDIINFQVWINTNGQIKYVYGNCVPDPTSTSAIVAFVALRSNHFSDGQWRGVASGNVWGSSATSAASTSARFTNVAPAASPTFNLTYTYTPRACATAQYAVAPACETFENAWLNSSPDTLEMRPTVYWTTWPGRGNGSWAREDNIGNVAGWQTPSSGAYAPNGANTTQHSARFHTTTTPSGVYGDFNYYVDFSQGACATSPKELSFYYRNTNGNDSFTVWMSTTGPTGTFTKLAINGTATSIGVNSGWVKYIVPLGTLTSSTCVFRFRATADLGSSTTGTDIGLDDVCVGVAVSNPPLVEMFPTGGATVCGAGQGIVGASLLAVGAATYTWSPATGLSSATGASVIASPVLNTIYTIVGTDAFCNTASATISVSVKPIYDLSITSSANYLCVNGTTTMVANDTIYGSNTLANYCAAPAPTNNSGSFCITNVSIGSVNSSSAATCGTTFYTNYGLSQTTNLYAGNTYPFTGTLATGSGSMSVWIDYNRDGIFQQTEYTSIVVNSGAGNPYTQNIIIPSNAVPGLTKMRVRSRVSASGINASDACSQFSAGGETEDYTIRIITSPVINSLNIDWQPTTFLNNNNATNVIASNVVTTTTYTATITDILGCNTSATTQLSVTPMVCNPLTASPTIACVGGTSVLKSHVSGGGQPYTFLWTGPNITGTAIIPISFYDSAPVTPNAPTTYTLVVTDACGNSCTKTITLNVYTPPTLNVVNAAGGPLQVCGTNSTSISLKASGALSYTWAPAPTFTSAIGDSIFTITGANTSYVITGLDANGCTASSAVTIIFRPDYPITATATQPYVCAGGTSTLNVSDTVLITTPLSTNYCKTNLHFSAGTCIDSVKFGAINNGSTTCALPSYNTYTNTVQAIIKTGFTYALSIKLAGFGYSSAWLDLNGDGIFDPTEFYPVVTNGQTSTVNIFIPLGSTIGNTILRVRSRSSSIGPFDACAQFGDGETEDYQIQIGKVSPAAINSYSWTPTAALSTNNGNPVITNPVNSTTSYIVTTTDVNGCTKNAAVQVIVAPLVCTAITSSIGSTICSGKSTLLTANYTGGGPTYTYNWQGPTGSIGNTKNILVSPTTTTTYTVSVSNGCVPVSTCTQTITITVNNSPTLTISSTPASAILCGSGNAQLIANGASTYSWIANNIPANISSTSGATVTVFPLNTTIYTVTGTAANGCTGTSSVQVVFSPTNSITAIADPSGIALCNSSANLSVSDTAEGPQVLPTGYCASIATNPTQADITYFEMGNLVNVSSCTTTGGLGSSLNKYSDFTTVLPAITMFNNTYQTFTVSVSDCNFSATTFAMVKIYVDFDRNGQFSDQGELVFTSPFAQQGPFGETGNIVIPSFAKAGLTRMRVIVTNTNIASGVAACSNYTQGETEDYLVNIKTTPVYPCSYVWNPGNIPSPGATVSPSATTTYTVVCTNTVGCTTLSTVTVTVGGVQCNNISTTASSICQGSSAVITANASLGKPPYTYLWNTGDTSKNITINPSVTTTYTVTTKDDCNATCSKTITITIVPKPTLTIGSSLASGNGICISGTNTLTASSNAISPIFSWTPNTNLNVTNTASVIISNPTSNNTYTVMVSGSNGCTNTATYVAKFSPTFSVTADANLLTVCPNTSTTLIASDTIFGNGTTPNYGPIVNLHSNNGPCIVEVNIANTYTNNTASTCPFPSYLAATTLPVATLYTGTTVPLIVTTSTNSSTISACTISAWIDWNRNGIFDTSEYISISTNSAGFIPNSINVAVPSFAQPGYTKIRVRARLGAGNIATAANIAFASGETEDYLVEVVRTSVAIPISQYAWSGPSGLLGNGVTKVVASVPNNSTYTVVATNAYGCTATSTVAIKVQTLGSTPVTGKLYNCETNYDTLSAHAIFGGSPYFYSWASSVPNTIVNIYDSNVVVNLSATTVFTVTISDACGSSVTRTFLMDYVPAQQLFVFPTNGTGVCGTGVLNVQASTGFASYTWSPSSFLSSTNGDNINIINPTSNIAYTVKTVDAFGCTYTANYDLLYSDPITVSAIGLPAAICAGQSTQLKIVDTFTGPQVMPNNYCGSSASSNTVEEILNFTLGSQSNTSDCFTPAPGAGSVLGQYSNFTTIAAQNLYSNNQISFSALLSNCLPSNNTNAMKIYIDWNRDGDFYDSKELVYTSTITYNGTHTETGTITVPNVITAGVARMRVVMIQTNNINNINPCGTYNQGETEDYIVNLINTPQYLGTQYSWSAGTSPNFGNIVTVNPSATSTYTATMSNAAGCTATTDVQVTVGPLVPGVITQSTIIAPCIGGLDTLSPNPSGGGAPYKYVWSDGDTNRKKIIILPSVVNYTVTVSDACNNTATTSISITALPPPPMSITPIPSSGTICVTGNVNLTVNCATCASVKWINTNQNTASIVATPTVSSVYTVEGLDGYGCKGSTTIIVKKSFSHQTTILSSPSLVCKNGSTVLTALDSTIGSTFTPAPTGYCTPVHSGSSPCIGFVSITNLSNTSSNSCGLPSYTTYTNLVSDVLAGTTVPISVKTVISGPGAVSSISAWLDANKDGLFSASEYVQISAGVSPNTLATANITIPQNAVPGFTILRIRSKVIGTSNGPNDACTPFASGETEDYVVNIWNTIISPNTNYTWSPSANFSNTNNNPNTAINIASNTTFTVLAIDANGCSFTAQKNVTVNPPMTLTTGTKIVSCFGFSDGKIYSSVAGGIPPYTYSYSPALLTVPGHTDTAVLVPAGIYTVTVQDGLGCTTSKTVTLIQNPVMTLTITPINASCFGQANGGAAATATGGVPPYTFVWIDSVGNQLNTINNTIANLPIGNYTVFANDSFGCYPQPDPFAVFSVSQPTAPITASAFVDSNVKCRNGADGQIHVSATGGGTSYTYALNGSNVYQLSPIFAGLSPGVYTVTVQDNNLCQGTTTITLINPALLVQTVTTTNAPCYGTLGTISVTVSGGVAPYTNKVNNNPIVAGYAANNYIVSTKDANACVVLSVAFITQPDSITLNATSTNPLCNAAQGSITPLAAGGTPNYTFKINNLAPATGYLAGTYTVSVSDTKNCSKTITKTITQPSAIVINVLKTNASCFGGTGTITIGTTGGTGTKTVLINNLAPASSYAPGTYLVVATDANSCTKTTNVTITQAPALVLNTSVVNPNCAGGTGTIAATSTGGTGTKTFTVNNVGIAPSYVTGTYIVKVVDILNCSSSVNVTITTPTQIGLSLQINNPACNGQQGAIVPTVNGGTPTYTVTVNGVAPSTSYPVGNYTFTAIDSKGCSITAASSIAQPGPITLSASGQNPDCFGGNGSISTNSGGGSGLIHLSANGDPLVFNYPAGTYTIQATDDNNCSLSTILTLVDPPAIILTASAGLTSCIDSAANITVSATGGAGGFVYSVLSIPISNPYLPGTYPVEATDANACMVSTLITVLPAASIPVVASASSFTVCNNQTIVLTGSGATNLVWNGGAYTNGQAFVATSTQTYTLVGTDANSCTGQSTVFVVVNNNTNNLSQTYNNNDSSTAGQSCNTLFQLDGTMLNYSDANCNLIASVQDASGGNVLGNVTTCVNVANTLIPYNGKPYLARTYTITPTNQGPASVTLYYTQDDLEDYNATVLAGGNASPLMVLPINPQQGDSVKDICITKVSGGALGVGTIDSIIPVVLVYNALLKRWEANFAVTGFSSFYCSTCNPVSPSDIELLFFHAVRDNKRSILKWKTNKEVDNSHFEIERSNKPTGGFVKILTIPTKADGGNSNAPLAYTSFDESPMKGVNYYRLVNEDINGIRKVSNIEKVVFTNEIDVTVFPNPVQDELKIVCKSQLVERITIKVLDATGKLVLQVESELEIGDNNIALNLNELANGMYQINLVTKSGVVVNKTVTKQ